MISYLELKGFRLAPAQYFKVVCFTDASGHILARNIGRTQKQLLQLALGLLGLLCECLNLSRNFLQRFTHFSFGIVYAHAFTHQHPYFL